MTEHGPATASELHLGQCTAHMVSQYLHVQMGMLGLSPDLGRLHADTGHGPAAYLPGRGPQALPTGPSSWVAPQWPLSPCSSPDPSTWGGVGRGQLLARLVARRGAPGHTG